MTPAPPLCVWWDVPGPSAEHLGPLMIISDVTAHSLWAVIILGAEPPSRWPHRSGATVIPNLQLGRVAQRGEANCPRSHSWCRLQCPSSMAFSDPHLQPLNWADKSTSQPQFPLPQSEGPQLDEGLAAWHLPQPYWGRHDEGPEWEGLILCSPVVQQGGG